MTTHSKFLAFRKLDALGCKTIADARDMDPRPVRKSLTVVGERIIYELRGIPTIDLELVAAQRKGCAVTRMFSSRGEDLPMIEQAIASHASRLGEKLRRGGLGTDHVTVLLPPSEHDRACCGYGATVTAATPK